MANRFSAYAIAVLAMMMALPLGACASSGGGRTRASSSPPIERVSQSEQPGTSVEFDAKGVEFGPWVGAFAARLRSNWWVPYQAMTAKGHVVLTFRVRKDGAITNIAIAESSQVAALNASAMSAVSQSSPVAPLPSKYPDEDARFTVTFYNNETPAKR